MIITKTWIDDQLMQEKFDHARNQIANSQHPLSCNYAENFNSKEILACSMSYEQGEIFLCSSIARKEYWPIGVYRILNRVFKPQPTQSFTKKIQSYWADMVEQQLEFCQRIPDFQTAIVTRKLGYVNTLKQLSTTINSKQIQSCLYDRPVWICNDYHNPECLQNVLYIGQNVISQFKQVDDV
jgi:hypothetical protein